MAPQQHYLLDDENAPPKRPYGWVALALVLAFGLGAGALALRPSAKDAAQPQDVRPSVAAVAPAEAMPPAPAGEIRRLSAAVAFEFDSARLTPSGREALAKLVRKSGGARLQARVEGHTDATGPAGYNDELALRRAHAVASALQALGIPAEAIRTQGRGASAPAASNDTAAGRAKNRRAEIELSAGSV